MLLYIGALLATEYYLLKQNGQDLTRVKHELFCALNAVNRVDYKAETLYGTSAHLNGFFCKDDVPANFVKDNYKHFNYYNTWDGINVIGAGSNKPNTIATDKGFASLVQHGVFSMHSDWQSAIDDPFGISTVKGEESIDHLIDLLFGLTFVSKFVDSGATDKGITFPYDILTSTSSIKYEAQHISKRLINYVKNTNWFIKNGSTGNNVDDGHNAKLFAYAIAEAGCFIDDQGEALALDPSFLFAAPKTCNDFHNLLSKNKLLGYAPWNTLANSAIVPPSTKAKVDNATFVANLSAMCNCVYNHQESYLTSQIITTLQSSPVLNWLGVILNWVTSVVSYIQTTLHPGGYINNTDGTIANISYYYGHDYAPVARKILHPNVGVYIQNPSHSFEYLLNTAACEGAYNLGAGRVGHAEWSSDNRLDHPDRTMFYNIAWGGEFNGIDFMLSHNLWKIHEHQKFGTNSHTVDLDNLIINTGGTSLLSFAPSGISIATTVGAIRIDAFETITMENTTILAGQSINFRAGKTIYIGPGVSIVNPAMVHFDFPHPFTCTSGGASYFRHAVGDSTLIIDEGYNSERGSANDTYHYINYAQQSQIYSPLPLIENDEYTVVEGSAGVMDQSNDLNQLGSEVGVTVMGFPSPTKGKYTIAYNLLKNSYANVTIVDLMGNVIFEKNNLTNENKTVEVDLSNEANGVYLVKYITSYGIEKVLKVVKN